MNAFDRQTVGRTDGRTDRILIARPRLHFTLHGKNECLWSENKLQNDVVDLVSSRSVSVYNDNYMDE